MKVVIRVSTTVIRRREVEIQETIKEKDDKEGIKRKLDGEIKKFLKNKHGV